MMSEIAVASGQNSVFLLSRCNPEPKHQQGQHCSMSVTAARGAVVCLTHYWGGGALGASAVAPPTSCWEMSLGTGVSERFLLAFWFPRKNGRDSLRRIRL